MHFSDFFVAMVSGFFQLTFFKITHTKCFKPVALLVFEFLIASLGDHTADMRLDDDGRSQFHAVLPPNQITSTTTLINGNQNNEYGRIQQVT